MPLDLDSFLYAAMPLIKQLLHATCPNPLSQPLRRYAMLGFAAAILVEAATGNGIIGQVITYLKWSGALGERSGF
jgi:hypothetical protein